ncbi:Ctr copper transporter family-domain-containing protein [Mortierella sp. GBAus27b]|nr:Ctr copper transporter family-domain-containing protein [Mortierella sp. GBAus27b]
MKALSFLSARPPALLLLLALAMGPRVHAQVDCLVTPSDPSCVSFELPEATVKADLDNLCKQMPYMPGCSLYKSCQAASKTDQWCTPFSVLADICQVDMPSMRDCKNYVALCGASTNGTSASRPAVCSKAPMISSFPTTKNASALVIDICTEMDMAGCERCPKPPPGAYAADCDTLGTYAILCKAMPDMHQCATWKSMCSASSDTASVLNFQSSEYCAMGVGSPDMNPPAMRMYFHLGYSDYVLFEKWVPRNQSQYVGTWFALFFITIFFQTIQAYHNSLEARWAEEHALQVEESSGTDSSAPLTDAKGHSSSILLHWVHLWRQPWTLKEAKQNVIRAVLTFVETTLGYALMLVTMTFNVPLFFAVIVGLTVGSVMFSRQRLVTVGKPGASSGGTGCAGCG